MPWFSDIHHIWIVAIYPLLAFLIIVLGRAFGRNQDWFPKQAASALTITATFLGLLHTLFVALPWLLGPGSQAGSAIEQNVAWLTAGNFTLSIGCLIDSMSVMMLFVVTFISLLIQIYTHGYMKHDPGYAKFFGYLALFNFSMLGLVLSTNLFQIYIFWELVGVSSYLLIGFWFTKPSAAAAAVKAFLMNRVGDFGFLFGILGLLYFSYPLWSSYLADHPDMALLSFRALPDLASSILSAANAVQPWFFTAIALLLFMGPMAKSAQLPLHTWLPDAMEGPTPISALIHAATMVAAGVYLIGRTYPIFSHSETAMIVVATIGTLTAVVAATIALTQYDIKKALAYSTMSQLGFMVAGMGVGAFTAGLFHLFTHAFFKAMLFLCSGSVIHACEDEQDMRKMGGLAKKLPITHITYLIGCLAISGLLWTSGFWSKDMILEGAKENGFSTVYWNLAITAGVTSFYMFRTYFLTFQGKYRGQAHVHHEDPWMVWPLAILAIPSALIGVAMAGLADIHWLPAFGQYIHYPAVTHEAHHAHTFLEAIAQNQVGVMSAIIGFAGFLLAYLFYGVAPVIPEIIKSMPIASSAFNLFSRKWYFDDIYQSFVDRVYLAFARGSAEFDRGGIDGVVNGTGRAVLGSGFALRELQSGKIQTYIAIMFFSVVTLTLLLFYWLM
ncbi:MAG: NADH:ubiquinone oxidoreductase subunit [Vampirovibrio sp.]|jgi:NAD(P)H-quinone oxidoreductase subunit 5|nr:NADH:ubiquinone oxidoreductase subunit [Vampirovibrio sp.]